MCPLLQLSGICGRLSNMLVFILQSLSGLSQVHRRRSTRWRYTSKTRLTWRLRMSLWERPPGIRRMVELEYRSIAPNRVMEEACGLDIQQRCRPDQHGIFHVMAMDLLGFFPKIKMEILSRRVRSHPIRQLVVPVLPVPQEMMTLPTPCLPEQSFEQDTEFEKDWPKLPETAARTKLKDVQASPAASCAWSTNSHWHVSFPPENALADASTFYLYHFWKNPKRTIWIFDIDITTAFEYDLNNFSSLTHPSPENPVLRTVAGWLRHSLHSFTCTSFLRKILTMKDELSISKLIFFKYIVHAKMLKNVHVILQLCNLKSILVPCLNFRIQRAWYGMVSVCYFILGTCFFFDVPSSLQRGALNGIAPSNCTKQLMRCARWLLQ